MARNFINNPYIKTLAKAILLFACFHLVIIFLLALRANDLERISVFRLLDLDAFIPSLPRGPFGFIGSYLLFGLVYLLILFFTEKRRKK